MLDGTDELKGRLPVPAAVRLCDSAQFGRPRRGWWMARRGRMTDDDRAAREPGARPTAETDGKVQELLRPHGAKHGVCRFVVQRGQVRVRP